MANLLLTVVMSIVELEKHNVRLFATFCESNQGSLQTKKFQETHTSRFGKAIESECK